MKDDRGYLIALVLIICVFCLFFNTVFNTNRQASAQSGSSYIVFDAGKKEVISGENIHYGLENASTTKIVTLIVALENIKDLDEYVCVDRSAAGTEGSSIYLKEGQRWKIKDLLYGMMLRSGNDAAIQVALATFSNQALFVEKMNELVCRLGLKHTHFENVTGLSQKGHFTSAYDLAVLTAYGFEKHPLFQEIVGCKYYTTDKVYLDETETVFTFKNKNKLLFSFDGACGVKTGYTKNSGRCLVAAAKRSDTLLIYVCLNKYDMWSDASFRLEEWFNASVK